MKSDIIIGTSPQFFSAISAFCIAKVRNKNWVMEVRDLWPDSIVTVGSISKKSIIFKILKIIERKLYLSADKIIVVTESFRKIISNVHSINFSKIKVIKNGYKLDLIHSVKLNKSFLNRYKFDSKPILTYIGTHGLAHGLDFILDCANFLQNQYNFLFIGDGAMKNE